MTTYEAKQDNVGALVPLQNRRRCVVVKYQDGKFVYICGAFSTMKAAEKRAAYLNANHMRALTTHAADAVERVDALLRGAR